MSESERNFNIAGKDIDGSKNEFTEYLNRKSGQGLEPMEGEIEKTEEEIKFVDLINTWLKKEFRDVHEQSGNL